MKTVCAVLVFGLAFFALTTPLSAIAISPEEKVSQAIKSTRQGDFSQLVTITEANAVSALKYYLNDKNEDIRRAVLTQLTIIASPTACQTIVPALVDESADIRERAAQAVYDCHKTHPETNLELGDYPRRSIELGTAAAQVYLLLAINSSEKNAALLKEVVASGEQAMPVKLKSFLMPVPASLPAAVALAQNNTEASAIPLRHISKSGEIADIVFLLHVLNEISDLETLRSLAGYLENNQEIGIGVPSHAEPKRRLADLTLDTFAEKFNLSFDFSRSGAKRYSPVELATARTAIFKVLDRL